MKVELLGAVNYNKFEEELQKIEGLEEIGRKQIVEIVKKLEDEERVRKVAAAGMLSRSDLKTLGIYDDRGTKSFKGNTNVAKGILKKGHDSVADHDYFVFALEDVPIIIEQTIIAQRYSSFTIKSRRLVDYYKEGFFIPDFHDKDGNIHKKNKEIQEIYCQAMQKGFNFYHKLTELGIEYEDARFVLPYSYNACLFMGVDAHTLTDMIISYTKTHLSLIPAVREFGEKLYEIAKVHAPYILDKIDNTPYEPVDKVASFIDNIKEREAYEVLEKPVLLSHSDSIDDSILISALMKRYQYTYSQAEEELEVLNSEYFKQTGKSSFKEEFMRKIVFESDKLELHSVHFRFQIPISFAVLTHYTRHRSQNPLIPEFAPTIDLHQYKIPPAIIGEQREEYKEYYKQNAELYSELKAAYDLSDNELTAFTLSGNMVNTICDIDGWSLAHILGVRECERSQWETCSIAKALHNEVRKIPSAKLFASMIGPTCLTQNFCKEGEESCGRLEKIHEKQKKLTENS